MKRSSDAESYVVYLRKQIYGIFRVEDMLNKSNNPFIRISDAPGVMENQQISSDPFVPMHNEERLRKMPIENK